MRKNRRDDFTKPTRDLLAKRAGWLCSFPSCSVPTVGATSDNEGVINIGTAAHICAAAPGGPRYDESQSPEERSAVTNGIWMCRNHGTAIDSTDSTFTVQQLLEWKKRAESESWRRVLRNEMEGGYTAISDVQLATRLRDAAVSDLKVFRETARWPSTSVALTLEVEGFDETVTPSALARAATSLGDLILIAPPGMGKTTTLFQISEGLLVYDIGIPLVVPLGDWATEDLMILDSVLKRPAFRGISEDNFRKVAAQPGVVLLLDGWNELDDRSRKRARVQISAIKAQLPDIAIIVSTRKQALDVPFIGMRIDLLPLAEDQQMEIARSMGGEVGVKILDHAWRTAGIRDLVTIPLYLMTLLSLPSNAPFPTTKEEVLRHFVNAHENEASRAETLYDIVQGFQQDYLVGLASCAMRTENTAISDNNARRCVAEVENLLAGNCQIMNKPEPGAILNVLVSSHVLMRIGDTPGYSFQHQQFQEWYASHTVERRILDEVCKPLVREALKAEVFNLPIWEEAILFAIERMARGDMDQRVACGEAITAAFEVDPILAAEMIYRSTEDVWKQIASTIQLLVARWHVPGKVDRALRFMLTSGRPEFLDKAWSLITDDNDQISLRALRNCKRFRPSILGADPEMKIKALSRHPRIVLLCEMASHSDVDGLDLASAIAKNDADPEVQASVVEALAFRHAHRHVTDILQKASEQTFDLIVSKGIIDEVDDEQVQKGIAEARIRLAVEKDSANDRLRVLLNTDARKVGGSDVANIISTMEIDEHQGSTIQLINMALDSYPSSVVNGLLARVRTGRTLFYETSKILASSGFALEDDELLELALVEPCKRSNRAEAAASVLGPIAVGSMVNALLGAGSRLRADACSDRNASDMYRGLKDRVAHTSGASLVAAVLVRSAQVDNEQIAQLAEILSRSSIGETDSERLFDVAGLGTIQGLVYEWGNRMLASGNAKRWQTAKLVELASCAASLTLLPILKQLLDDNLRRLRAFRAEAEATSWRRSDAANEARTPHLGSYQRAFMAIPSSETSTMMMNYLADEDFGEIAAQVIAEQWRITNETLKDKYLSGGIDFSHVEEKRLTRASDPDATSAEAEIIFKTVENLIAEGATDEQKKLAVTLGIIASGLPHGQRPDLIQKLIALAPRRMRSRLLLNLVLSGEVIAIKVVTDGINETLEAAKTQQWILTQSDGYELKVWLQLLPFVSRPIEALSVVRSMPPMQRNPDFLRKMIEGLTYVPSREAEEVLFRLAEEDRRFYSNYHWRVAALGIGTLSAARRIVDLTCMGVLSTDTAEEWHLAAQLGNMIKTSADLRDHVYSLLRDGPDTPGLLTLARAVADNPDEVGLLLLVGFANALQLGLVGDRVVERIVTKRVPVESWSNAYDILPIPAPALRKKLFALTSDGGPADVAACCLRIIDQYRDEHGTPEGEPRHPDLESSKPWPIMPPAVEAEDSAA